MSNAYSVKVIKDKVSHLGFITHDVLRENERWYVVVEDNTGYKGKVIYQRLLKHNSFKIFHSSNPYTVENINLWTKINMKDFYLLDKYFHNSGKKMNWHCNICSETFSTSWDSIKSGRGCGVCKGLQVKRERSLGFVYDDISREWSERNKISAFDVAPKSNKKYIWKCSECNYEWSATVYSRTCNGSGCPKCSFSKGEKEILKFLEKSNVKYVSQKKFADLKRNLSFDFYLPEYNICIEYNGKQHYEPIKYFGGNKNFEKQTRNDNAKRSFCEQNNIYLIEIPHWKFSDIYVILMEALFE